MSSSKNIQAIKTLKLFTVIVAISSALAFSGATFVNWFASNAYSVKSGDYVFKGLKANISFDEQNPEKSKIQASIEAKTISTGNDLKNAHAREALATDKFPLITFVSTSFKKTGTGRYEATGNLTLKGVTKEIKIPFAFDSQNNLMDRFPMVTKETFSGQFTIHPKDFGITRAGTPDQATIELMIPVTR